MRSFIAGTLSILALLLFITCIGGFGYIILTSIIDHAADVVMLCGCFIGSVVLLYLSSEISAPK